MTAEYRALLHAESERRELLRAERFESFVQRTLAANRAAQERAREACEAALREKRPQLVLEFQI